MYHSCVPLSRRGYAAIVARLFCRRRRRRASLPRRARLHHSRRRHSGHAGHAGRLAHPSFTREPKITIPTRAGDIPARLYKPDGRFRRTVLLMPGVHRDGINESRLVGLAEDLAATGYNVLTVAAPDLQKFKITPQVTDVIEDAIQWTSEQPQFRTDGKIGVLGISFTGGLSIVAAGRESIRDRVAFVMSFGGHGDLARAMHYLDLGRGARRSRSGQAQFGGGRRRSRRRASAARLRPGGGAAQPRRSRGAAGPGRARCRKASTASCSRRRSPSPIRRSRYRCSRR